jgi:osmotically-inducible protein OsmY
MSTSERKHLARPTAPRPKRAAAGHPQTDASEARSARVATTGENSASAAAEHDDQLRELVRQRLTEDPSLDASDVRVEVHNGRVTLAGTATSTRSRAEIEQTVENCGVLEVDNQLRPLS